MKKIVLILFVLFMFFGCIQPQEEVVDQNQLSVEDVNKADAEFVKFLANDYFNEPDVNLLYGEMLNKYFDLLEDKDWKERTLFASNYLPADIEYVVYDEVLIDEIEFIQLQSFVGDDYNLLNSKDALKLFFDSEKIIFESLDLTDKKMSEIDEKYPTIGEQIDNIDLIRTDIEEMNSKMNDAIYALSRVEVLRKTQPDLFSLFTYYNGSDLTDYRSEQMGDYLASLLKFKEAIDFY